MTHSGPRRTALVVFNTQSGIAGAFEEIATRACAPDQHPCLMTVLVRTAFGVRPRFRGLFESLGLTVEFRHRDEFVLQYRMADVEAPAVLRLDGDVLRQWIGASAIRACQSIEDLERIVGAAATAPTTPGAPHVDG